MFNQWIAGRISQNFPNYRLRYNIQYANRRLILNKNLFSLIYEIRDEQWPNNVLARIKKRLSSIIWSNKYGLDVYTNELPDVIYLLSIFAFDYSDTSRKRSG